MYGFEVNKIFATIIVVVVVFIIVDFVGDSLIRPKILEEQAYKIEISEENVKTQSTQVEMFIEPVSPILSTSSLENGAKVAKKCSSCHTFDKDGQNKIGPNLYNIIGSGIAKKTGYAYSNALVNFGGNWDFEKLANFLYKPKDYIDGTKMNFAGLKKVEDRADLILWLREKSDNPIPLP